jgi:thioredoxin-like negative regulator of GroEL
MDGARELAERIKTDYPMEQHAPAIKAALSLIELAESNTGSDSIETLQQQIKDDPENMVRLMLCFTCALAATAHFKILQKKPTGSPV